MSISSEDDRSALWAAIEANYWKSTGAVRAREDRLAEEALQTRADLVREELKNLYLERAELEERLKKVNALCLESESRIEEMEEEGEQHRQRVAQERAADDEQKRAWFKSYRYGDTGSNDAAAEENPEVNGMPTPQTENEPDAAEAEDEAKEDGEKEDGTKEDGPVENGAEENGAKEDGGLETDAEQAPEPQQERQQQQQEEEQQEEEQQEEEQQEEEQQEEEQQQQQPQQQQHLASQNSQEIPAESPPGGSTLPYGAKTGAKVYDSNGELLVEMTRIARENRWISKILTLPIKRAAIVRPGKRFATEGTDYIYDAPDAKSVKWLACHVQASGTVQPEPCQTCVKPAAVFTECVVVGGPDFPRCGNCEWNRLGCYPLSRKPSTRPSSSQGEARDEGTTPRSRDRRASRAAAEAAAAAEGSEREGDCASRPKSARKRSRKEGADVTPAADAIPATDDKKTPPPPLPEITQDTVQFKDDGVVFTEPFTLRGVPLAKISAAHEYWDASWASVEAEVQSRLDEWLAKKQEHVNDPEPNSAAKFLANRQVNRGRATLEFLRDGEFHPYQIMAKKFITKNLNNYDVLFRMTQVLAELAKFKDLPVTPSQWLRQRLHEICAEKGEHFDLVKTVRDMYHDPKIKHLRAKNGFGNIGRPSGMKMSEKKKNKEPDPASSSSSSLSKRKEPHSTPTKTPPKRGDPVPAEPLPTRSSNRKPAPYPPPDRSPLPGGSDASSLAAKGDLTMRARHKKHKPNPSDKTAAPPDSQREDLEYSGYTTTDSFSGDRVVTRDWRVYQIKTSKMTTNPTVTQYWHWVDKADGVVNIMEHQVLKDVTRTDVFWGVYKDPYDFHLRLTELVEMVYAPGCPKVIIHTKPVPGVEHRGEILAHFKRERTKRRFLTFVAKKGVKLVRSTAEYVEKAWNDMQSDVLPGYDSES